MTTRTIRNDVERLRRRARVLLIGSRRDRFRAAALPSPAHRRSSGVPRAG
ncbi:hypothetical protein [Nonomuraea sp. 10N515B]